MPRYIDAEKIPFTKYINGSVNVEKEVIDTMPAADVQEVKHGKWIATDTYDKHKQPIYMCTNCNREVADYFIDRHAFCLFCGAKMDEVIKEKESEE